MRITGAHTTSSTFQEQVQCRGCFHQHDSTCSTLCPSTKRSTGKNGRSLIRKRWLLWHTREFKAELLSSLTSRIQV
ncbi:hypothetical protein M758_UG114100 [Ceratodon purpureus]|nr:hypothetical protein M758_UG114100 [Ceratodon purpureus]